MTLTSLNNIHTSRECISRFCPESLGFPSSVYTYKSSISRGAPFISDQGRKSNSMSHKIAMRSYCSIQGLWNYNFFCILYEYETWFLNWRDERVEGVGEQGAEQNICKYEAENNGSFCNTAHSCFCHQPKEVEIDREWSVCGRDDKFMRQFNLKIWNEGTCWETKE